MDGKQDGYTMIKVYCHAHGSGFGSGFVSKKNCGNVTFFAQSQVLTECFLCQGMGGDLAIDSDQFDS